MARSTLYSFVAASSLLLISQVAGAADGTIHFAGELVDSTCVVSVDGNGSTGTITLPSIALHTLNANGKTAGRTHFNIGLTGCSDDTLKVLAFFEGGGDVDPLTGLLKNSAATGAATNVALRLVDNDDKPVNAGHTSQRNGPRFDITGTTPSGVATMLYGVEYLATGTATAGEVSSSVTFSVDYL